MAWSCSPRPIPGFTAAPIAHARRLERLVLLGVALVVIGAIFLGNNTGLVDWNVVRPVVVIGLGIVLMLRAQPTL